jgi:hypothetical protein
MLEVKRLTFCPSSRPAGCHYHQASVSLIVPRNTPSVAVSFETPSMSGATSRDPRLEEGGQAAATGGQVAGRP